MPLPNALTPPPPAPPTIRRAVPRAACHHHLPLPLPPRLLPTALPCQAPAPPFYTCLRHPAVGTVPRLTPARHAISRGTTLLTYTLPHYLHSHLPHTHTHTHTTLHTCHTHTLHTHILTTHLPLAATLVQATPPPPPTASGEHNTHLDRRTTPAGQLRRLPTGCATFLRCLSRTAERFALDLPRANPHTAPPPLLRWTPPAPIHCACDGGVNGRWRQLTAARGGCTYASLLHAYPLKPVPVPHYFLADAASQHRRPSWTRGESLPGDEQNAMRFERYVYRLHARSDALPLAPSYHLLRRCCDAHRYTTPFRLPHDPPSAPRLPGTRTPTHLCYDTTPRHFFLHAALHLAR